MGKGSQSTEPNKSAAEQAQERLQFLSQTFLRLSLIEGTPEAADYVCRQIKAIVGKGYVGLTLLDEFTQTLRLETLVGLEDNKLVNAGLRLSGTDPRKLQVSLDQFTARDLEIYKSGRLEFLSDGLYTLLVRNYPRVVCEALAGLLDIRCVYTMGLLHLGNHFGGVAILTDSRAKVEDNRLVIENVIAYTASVVSRINLESKLRESNEKHRLLLDESSDPIFSFDLQGRYTYVNQALARAYNKPVQDITGKTIWDFFPRDVAEKRVAALNEAFQSGQQKIIEGPVWQKDGIEYYLTTITPLKDQTGKVVSALCISKNITERKNLEDALKQSEARLKTTILNAPLGIATSGLNKRFLSANAVFCQELGYSEDELKQMTFKDITFPADQSESFKHMAALDAGEVSSFRLEKRYVRKDGGVITCRICVSLARDGEGQPLVYVAELENITQRKQDEEKLRLSEVEHRTTLETAMDGFWQVDIQGRLLEVNEAYSRMSGFSRQELLGMRVSDLECSENQAETAIHMKKIMQQGEDRFESRHRRKDGTLFDVETSAQYLPELGGKVVAFLRDITERKMVEMRMRESEEKFRLAFMTSLDAFYMATLDDGLILEVNNNFESVFGYSRDEVIGKTSLELGLYYDPQDRARMVSGLKTKGYVRDQELQGRKKDGKLITISLSVAILIINNQKHILGVIRDISEHKRSEEKLKRAAQQLDKSYQKEKQQRQELEAEAKTRGLFIDILGHELRTPLTPLIACSGMLLETLSGQNDGIQKTLINNICKSSDTLASRLEELLDLAKFSRGTFTLKHQDCDLTLLLSSTLDQFKPQVEKQSKQIILELPDNLPIIQADPLRLQQVLDNLVSNAIKFSPTGTNIYLTANRTVSEINIEVRDEGIGISDEEQKQLFSPYHRIVQDNSKFPGIGLGLAICKQIIDAHGGSIGVKSDVNRGCTFSVRLPFNTRDGGN